MTSIDHRGSVLINLILDNFLSLVIMNLQDIPDIALVDLALTDAESIVDEVKVVENSGG